MGYPFVSSAHDLGIARGPRLATVWHMAEGGGTVGYLSRPNPNGVSVHFVVERSARVVQMLRLDHMHTSIRTSAIRVDDDPPYLAGAELVTYGRTAALGALGAWADIRHGTLGPNHATIAVEVEGYAATGPNDAQSSAIAELAAYLDLPAELGHRDFADYKACPGHHFPWAAIGGHARSEGSSMRLTAVSQADGRATMIDAGPVWNVATGDRVNVDAGASWLVVGACRYDSPGESGTGTSPGYMIAANAADHELHVVAQSRVTFAPASSGTYVVEVGGKIVGKVALP